MEIFYFLTKKVKCRLLQNYRMRERVNTFPHKTNRKKNVEKYDIIIYPFPHTTILQQTTLNIFCQKIENLYNWMNNLWLKVENIVTKRAISSFVTMFSKSCLLQRRHKVSIWGRGFKCNHWIYLALNLFAKGQLACYEWFLLCHKF